MSHIKALNKAYKILTESETLNEQQILNFLGEFSSVMSYGTNIPKGHRTFIPKGHRIFVERERILRRLVRRKILKGFSESTYDLLLAEGSYFLSNHIIPVISQESFNKLWDRKYPITNNLESFLSAVQFKDVEKVRAYYTSDSRRFVGLSDSDRNASGDQTMFVAGLGLAIEMGEESLIKLIVDNTRGLRWRDLDRSAIEAFQSVADVLDADKVEKAKRLVPILKHISPAYQKVASLGLGKVLNQSPALMFKARGYFKLNFYNPSYHHGRKLDPKSLLDLVRNKITPEELKVEGDRLDEQGINDNDHYKIEILEFWKSLQEQNSAALHESLDSMVGSYTRPWFFSTTYPYFSSMMMLKAENVPASFYRTYSKKISDSEEWFKDFNDRIVKVDNIEVFKEIELSDTNRLHFASIATIFNSKKVLEYVSSQLTLRERDELSKLELALK